MHFVWLQQHSKCWFPCNEQVGFYFCSVSSENQCLITFSHAPFSLCHTEHPHTPAPLGLLGHKAP